MAAEQHIDIEAEAFIQVMPRMTAALGQRIHELLQQRITAIFTSKNAVNSVIAHYRRPVTDGRHYFGGWTALPAQTDNSCGLPGWNVYCLRGATNDAVQNTPELFRIKALADDAASMVALLAAAPPEEQVVFFCGNIRRDVLPDELRKKGIPLEELVVYDTTELPAQAAGHYDGMLFFSPSAVRSFFSVNGLPAHTVCFAIGNTTASELEAYTDNKIIVSTGQSMADVVQTAILYFNNIN
jgi:uroporphyrinogen-III synthase